MIENIRVGPDMADATVDPILAVTELSALSHDKRTQPGQILATRTLAADARRYVARK